MMILRHLGGAVGSHPVSSTACVAQVHKVLLSPLRYRGRFREVVAIWSSEARVIYLKQARNGSPRVCPREAPDIRRAPCERHGPDAPE